MASLLNNINQQQSVEGLRMVIAAQEKTGKTTFCSQAPDALLIPTEVGYRGVINSGVNITGMVTRYSDVTQTMSEIITYCQQGQFPFRTLVFDSATALERFIHDEVISLERTANATMETAQGGYGKAYALANEKFNAFLNQCDFLAVNYGINIALTCHVFASKVIDPNSGEYDSWDLQLHSPKNQKTYGKRELITQWADVIGFMYEPLFISKGEGESVKKAVSKNQGRVLGVSRTPSYNAGNRFGMQNEIPISVNNGWNDFANVLHQHSGIDVFNRKLSGV